ncbi:MAG TPA: EAL domain-containing protein [Acetobacteraceae bacterium]|jgi:diguanylate cyclase (GGDEF)-like protein/PAS domain S-box-containing protein
MLRVIGCITQQHDLRLVAVAALICALACGTTLNLVARAQTSNGKESLTWVIAAAAVFGCGVWSLHFVAELAYTPGIPIAYSIPLTVVSAFVAIVGSLIALSVWLYCPSRTVGVAAGGTLLGLAVSAMHYSGVKAMRVPGTLHFDRDQAAASIVVAVAFAILALGRSGTLASPWRRVEAIGWLALSICGLHFTAMSALSIELGQASNPHDAVLGTEALAVTVGSVSMAILIVSLAATLMEQRLSRRAVLELKRMRLMSDISQEILIIHRDGIILQVNAAGGRMFGVPEEQLVGRPMLDLVPEADHAAVTRRMRQSDVELNHEEIYVRTMTGALIPVEFSCGTIDYEGRPAAVVALRDLSDRKRDEARIRHLAHHDALTDLANRFLLQERMTHAMEASRRSGDILALLYLDLDHFKSVNDLLGHAAGDALLKQAAKRLRAEIRPTDILARIGGDEFVIAVSVDEPDNLSRLAGRLIEAMARPFDLDGQSVEIGTSIGIALFPQDGNSQQVLLHAADTALYRAKREKRGSFRFFEPAMDEHLQVRRKLEQDLRHALERGQLQVHYQPLVTCATGEVEGFEALLRWQHPEHGLVPPLDFITLAEETGLITKIGQWVLETACHTAAGWQAPRWVAVNVSPVQFRQLDLPEVVADILARSGLPPERLEIELTESVLIEDSKRAADVLAALRKLGVRVALDDFGTGYSSLSYLHGLKFDKLKIDRSFIAQLGEDEGSTVIVRTIIGLAHSLGLSIAAEGVETHQQLAIVRDLMCDQVQGYLLGRPMAMEGTTELVTARARSQAAAGAKVAARIEPMERRSDAQAEGVGSLP